jgi:hypothetical protein
VVFARRRKQPFRHYTALRVRAAWKHCSISLLLLSFSTPFPVSISPLSQYEATNVIIFSLFISQCSLAPKRPFEPSIPISSSQPIKVKD